ncbi:MAG: PAS domain-containing protein, partial [Bacteroidota bacterium]
MITDKNSGCKILIVDDDPDLLRITERLLKEKNFNVRTAVSGQECLQTIRLDPPDLLLLDVMLPDMSGIDICKTIRNDPGLSSIYIVLLSGIKTHSENISEGLEKGADDYLTKPVKRREFHARIGAAFRTIRAEKKLRESEDIIRVNIENSFDVIFTLNNEGIFLFVSPAWERHFDYPVNNVVGKYFTQFVHPDDVEPCAEYLIKVLNTGKSGASPAYRARHNDGTWRWFIANGSLYVNQKGEHQLIGVGHDITERKQIEETLQNERLLLRTVIDNIPDSIYAKDTACRKTLANLTEVSYMGAKSESEVLGKDDFVVYPKELAKSFFADDQAVMQTGKPLLNREEYILDEKKQKRYLLSSKLPLHDKDGQIIGLVGISHDITKRKLAELEIKLKNEELSKINSEKDKFFSIIAHDMRNPFNAFLGFTRMMVEELNTMSLEEIRKIVVSMRKSATNLYGLLENLLEWSMMQRGVIKYTPLSIPLALKIKESIELIIGSAQKKEIEISYNIPAGLSVFADMHMVESVIRNLISNAVKFTPKGGKITVSANYIEGNFIEISVRDTGIGMKKELMNNLFKLDEQTGRKGTEGEPTTGLGLIICKDFVEKHGGKIFVESEEGKG